MEDNAQPTTGGPPAWGMGEALTNSRRKKKKLRNVTQGLGIETECIWLRIWTSGGFV
jgi:hypothetical protein